MEAVADTALGRRRAAHRDLSAAPWLPETREHSTHDRNPHDDLIREDVNEVNRVHESCMEFVILILICRNNCVALGHLARAVFGACAWRVPPTARQSLHGSL